MRPRPMLPLGLLRAALLALPLAGPAAAAPSAAAHKTRVEVALEAPVEVPLISALDGSLVPCVWVQFGDQPAHRVLMALEIGDDDIVLSEAAILRLGGALRGPDDAPVRTARFDEASIGGLKLRGLEVIHRSAIEPSAPLPGQLLPGEGPGPEGSVGLGALQGLSWSIEPSAGRVRFAPGAEGARLIDELGGQALSLGRSAGLRVRRPTGEARQPAGAPLAPVGLPAAAPAAAPPPLTLALSTGRATTTLDRSALPEGGPALRSGDRQARPVELQLGPARVLALVTETSQRAVDAQFKKNDLSSIPIGVLGADVLGQLDLAYDPAGDRLGLRAAPRRAAASPRVEQRAMAEAALEKSLADTKAGEGEAGAAALPRGTAAAWSHAAAARAAAGELQGAVEARQAAAQLDPKGCLAHLDLGVALLAAGEPAAAENSLRAASTLWHAWGDLPTEVRAALDKPLQRATKAGTPYFFRPDELGFVRVQGLTEADVAKGAPAPKMPAEGAEITAQPTACHRADGWLAAAQGALGREGAAVQVYAERFDLDPNLALAAGNALLLQGDAAAALAPFRQSIKSFGQPASPGLQRLGLALATARAGGDAQSAAALAGRAAEAAPHDPLITTAYARLLLDSEGPAAAAAALRSFAQVRPFSVAAQLAYLQAATAAGEPSAVAEAHAAVTGAASRLRALEPELPEGWAFLALASAATGAPEAAAAAAAEAMKRAPGSALSHLAAAAAAAARGEGPAEAAALAAAARIAPFHPALAAR